MINKLTFYGEYFTLFGDFCTIDPIPTRQSHSTYGIK